MAENVKPVGGPGGPRAVRGVKPQIDHPVRQFMRLMKYLARNYLFHLIAVFILIIISVLANVQGTMFMKTSD